jgi:hypothetical protein
MADLSNLFGAGVQARTEEISIAYGKVNLQSATASYFAGLVEAPFVKKSAADTGQKVPGSSVTAAISDFQHTGAIYSCKVKHHPNTVIMLQTSWSQNGLPLRNGTVFIRLRASGPLISVIARMPVGRENKVGDRFTMFVGRGDVMDAAELEVLGIHVPHRYQQGYMDATELGEIYELNELAPELNQRPSIARVVVEGADGTRETKVVEMPVAPRRRIRLKR